MAREFSVGLNGWLFGAAAGLVTAQQAGLGPTPASLAAALAAHALLLSALAFRRHGAARPRGANASRSEPSPM